MDAGVDVLRHNRVVHLSSHDRVIRAVQTGDTDIGFIRTGVLEELLLESPDLMAGLKVINQQQLSGYPFVVSTRLYPEWPFVSLPHVDSRVVRRIASALFALERDHPAAQAAYIRGFSPPADYQSVETLARTLRMAPYDQVPRVTWLDVLNQYRVWGITVVLLLISLMITSLWLSRQRRQLAIEERRLRRLIASWPQPMLMIREAALVECNRAAVELVQLYLGSVIAGQGPSGVFSP